MSPAPPLDGWTLERATEGEMAEFAEANPGDVWTCAAYLVRGNTVAGMVWGRASRLAHWYSEYDRVN